MISEQEQTELKRFYPFGLKITLLQLMGSLVLLSMGITAIYKFCF